MADIYCGAKATLVWLGDAHEYTSDAIDILQRAAKYLQDDDLVCNFGRSLSSAMSREDFLSQKINDGLDSCTFSQDHSSSVFGSFRSLAFRQIPVSSLGCNMYQKQRSLMASCGCSTPDTRQTFRKCAYQSLKPAKS